MFRTFSTSFAIFYEWGALFMHILHSEKIEQPIEKLSDSFLDLSLNGASVDELKKRWFKSQFKKIINLWTDIDSNILDFIMKLKINILYNATMYVWCTLIVSI